MSRDALTSADYIKRLRAEAHAMHGLGQLDWHWAAADRLEELEAIATDLSRIHWDRNGYCNECGGQHPCLTLRIAAGVVATGDNEPWPWCYSCRGHHAPPTCYPSVDVMAPGDNDE